MIDMLCPSIPLMNTPVPALKLTQSPSWRHALCLCHHGLRPNLLPLHHRTPFLSPSTPTAHTHIVRIGRYPMELDEDEEEQVLLLYCLLSLCLLPHTHIIHTQCLCFETSLWKSASFIYRFRRGM